MYDFFNNVTCMANKNRKRVEMTRYTPDHFFPDTATMDSFNALISVSFT